MAKAFGTHKVQFAAIVVITLCAAFALRAWHLFHNPLWLDEAYTAYAAGAGFHFLWHVVPMYETHPPFYYTLVWLWTLLCGDSLPALRTLGLLAGMLAIVATGWATWELARATKLPRTLILAALTLAALATGLIDMSREVRPYALMALVYAVSIGALIRATAPVRATGRIHTGALSLYGVALALMLWLHNLGPLYGVSLGLAALILVANRNLPRSTWVRFFAVHGLAGLVYLPGFLILTDQASTWVGSTWLEFHLDRHLFGQVASVWATERAVMLPPILLLFAFGYVALVRAKHARVAAALVVVAVLPVLLSIALSVAVAPVFLPRTLTPLAVPAALLMASAVIGWGNPVRWITGGVAGALALWMLSVAINNRRVDPPLHDFYGAISWLAPRFQAGDQVFAYPNEGALPLDRAARDKQLTFTVRPIPQAVPAFADESGKWNPTGSRGVVSMDREHLARIADAPTTQAIPTIWLFRMGPEKYDLNDVFLKELLRHRVIKGRFRAGPIDIKGLRKRGPGDRSALPSQTVHDRPGAGQR